MTQQHINLGTAPAGTDGDTARTAWVKAESNFNELYSLVGFRQGTYAARPAAGTVPEGSVYFARDVQESYIATAGEWVPLLSGGAELGYAQLSTTFVTNSTTAVDVPGMSITCKVGHRPIVVAFGGTIACTEPNFARLIAVCNGAKIGNILLPNNTFAAGSGGYNARFREIRLGSLTAGAEYTFKLQMLVIGTGNAQLYGSSADPDYASLQVRTA
ncbi:MAG TPA: hypothetical protein VGE88_07755 [Lysobacter sp.]